jgi:hypothetical protein
MRQELLRFQERHLDVAAHFEDREVLRERSVHADQAELTLAGLERQADVAELHGTRAVEQPWTRAEDPLHSEDEVGRLVDNRPHFGGSTSAFRVSGADGRTGKARAS